MSTHRLFKDIGNIPEHDGHKIGKTFIMPLNFPKRKNCTRLYKIQGFDFHDNVWNVYVSRLDKRTFKIPNKAPIFEGFKYDEVKQYLD